MTPSDRRAPASPLSSLPSSSTVADPDVSLTLDFRPVDDLADGQRWSTYADVERLCRGPEPVPDWVVTDRGAVDTELGVLKTGKEADVFLLERAVPGAPGIVMAAKRYRDEEHRSFHRSAAYTEGRRTRRSRDARALARKSSYGRAVASGQWAWAEWEVLKRLWTAGLPVPYPVQIDGTELLMELVVSDDGAPAPRLAPQRPDRERLEAWFEQVRLVLGGLARLGLAHGDLSPYNILAAGERLVVIDLPQTVDLVANPAGPDFLLRDCHNLCTWFRRRGLGVDAEELFAEVLAQAW